MRKASRLFQIIQILRLARHPITAAEIAAKLGVVSRSIYRDIETLQAMHVPVMGERGIGYILRAGFELPPMMLTIEETEAIILALELLNRTGDEGAKRAANRAKQKIAGALPPPLRAMFETNSLHAWGTVVAEPEAIDFAALRQAIREERKLSLRYLDAAENSTERIVQPIALIYYSGHASFVAWCELRDDFRTFRTDRVVDCDMLDAFFRGEGDRLRQAWTERWNS